MSIEKDIIIIGGGPAGLTAAQYAARGAMNTGVIEEMATGGQAAVIHSLENYPGFDEPINGFDLAMKMTQQAERFGAEIIYDSVDSITKEDELFKIKTQMNEYIAKAVIMATGAKHRHLGVPGEEDFQGRGVSYCATCDGPFFKNKKILVVGGGDAACDDANYLANLTETVTVIHRRDRFRAQKKVADRVINNPNITVNFNTVLKEIKGEGKVQSVILEDVETKEQREEEFDAVFIFIGTIPNTHLVPDTKKDETGYIITNEHMESSIKGIYAAGDVRNTTFRQVITAAGDGATAAFAAIARVEDLKGEAYN